MSHGRTLKGKVAIAGVGSTAVGRVPGKSALELTMDAAEAALADAGLQWKDIDGLYTTESRVDKLSTAAPNLAEHVGIHPSFVMTMPTGGMQFVSAIFQGAAAIEAGLATTVMLICADNMLTGRGSAGAVDHFAETGHPRFENVFGATIPSLYALIAQRHMHEYGTTVEQLAAVTVQMRANAAKHPGAQMREPVTVKDVLASRMITSPLRRLNCALISDGGVAFILTSSERAADLRSRPVTILGAGEGRSHMHVTQAANLARLGARDSSRRAFEMAGVSAKDFDVAFLYDAFSILPILSLEALGFCGEGEGGPFVEAGHVAPTGRIPMNPHGGCLGYGNPGRPGGFTHVAEAVWQLRGQAKGIQIPDAKLAVFQGNAGILSGEFTLVLGA